MKKNYNCYFIFNLNCFLTVLFEIEGNEARLKNSNIYALFKML